MFAALAGAIMLGERLTALGALGCALILLGAVVVEAAAGARAKGCGAGLKPRRLGGVET